MTLVKLILRYETMYETCGQNNIASTSIQTYDNMETFKLSLVNEKCCCVRKKFKFIVANKKYQTE